MTYIDTYYRRFMCDLQVHNSTNALSVAEFPCLPVRGKENNTDGELDDTAINFALEDSSLLECEALSSCEPFLRFRRIVVSSSSESNNPRLHNLTVEE